MHDVGLLPTRFARIVLSAAVIEDIVLDVILAVAVGLVQTAKSTAFGIPAALRIHTITQNSVYHTIIAGITKNYVVDYRQPGRVYSLVTTSRYGSTLLKNWETRMRRYLLVGLWPAGEAAIAAATVNAVRRASRDGGSRMGRARTAGPRQFPRLVGAVPRLVSSAFPILPPPSLGSQRDGGPGRRFPARLSCRTRS